MNFCKIINSRWEVLATWTSLHYGNLLLESQQEKYPCILLQQSYIAWSMEEGAYPTILIFSANTQGEGIIQAYILVGSDLGVILVFSLLQR